MENRLVGKTEIVVTEADTAAHLGSGFLPVLATPRLVALMEEAACVAISACMNEGETTVGTRIDVEHLSATPVGMRVFAEASLVAREGRAFSFAIEAFDEAGLIANATHTRFLVNAAKFLQKAQEKGK